MRKILSLGTVSILLLVEFSMFYDFFSPFRFLWSEGKVIELILSVLVFLWSLAGVFLIFFSGRSLIRKITLPFFMFFFLSNIGSFLVSNAPIDFQQADLIVSYFQWWAGAVVENIGLAVLPLFIILVPLIIFTERLPGLLKLNIPGKLYAVPVSTVLLAFIVLLNSDGILIDTHLFSGFRHCLCLPAKATSTRARDLRPITRVLWNRRLRKSF
ncbi:hypothetical protein BKP64_07545 [Marinobacter salinus]|uniref:Uncharacterized protein n=1 Tax=Marinobacter salinus TaxID=1874317 RepID=A0A1D9GKK8_9GAMM|nr:hypothetical protein [Marinobacter salinus]AOY88035.1 hypothetical protein BKP64_07545 [Marinobacter salinus]